MTSMTDANGDAGHPDVAEISDLAEGLLGPARSGEVRSHLDACALCADVRSSLDEIRGLLGTLPGPSRMPADVAGRIDAALAAEALLGTMEPGTGRPPGPSPSSTRTTMFHVKHRVKRSPRGPNHRRRTPMGRRLPPLPVLRARAGPRGPAVPRDEAAGPRVPGGRPETGPGAGASSSPRSSPPQRSGSAPSWCRH